MTDEVHNGANNEERDFEDLTLAEAIRDLLRQPFETARRLMVVTDPARKRKPIKIRKPNLAYHAELDEAQAMPEARLSVRADLLRFALLAGAVLSALTGSLTVFRPHDTQRLGILFEVPAVEGLIWWGLAAVLTIVALRFVGTPVFDYEDEYRDDFSEAVGFRPLLLLFSLPLLAGAFMFSTGNRFSAAGVLLWAAGIAAMVWAFLPRGLSPLLPAKRVVARAAALLRGERSVALALLVIVAVGAYGRLNGLDRVPAEMTSDHVEKILDSQRVLEGEFDIFFANDHGREPIQMYFIALLAGISGGSVTFAHLKLAALIESLAGIPLMFVLGRVVIGERDRRLGTLLGLVLALFVAAGYWHIAITRVSLRIMLTPLITTLFLIFTARLLRHNRREDAIAAGLTIGLGLYAYQALRMLPVVAVVAAIFALIFAARGRRQRFAVVLNLAVIAAVSFAVFVPLLKYSTEFPDEFWRRAQGRLLGDDIITEVRPDGSLVYRDASLIERATAFASNLPRLGANIVRALGMFTYRGDVAWLHNAPNYPAFEPLMGAFFIVGAAACAIWAVQKRELTLLFLYAVLILMLVPSAVAIAIPDENPSNTRASGAMPVAYLFAAFGAVTVTSALGELLPRRSARVVQLAIVAGTAGVGLSWAFMVLFGPYDDFYQNSWSPQREAGLFMRGVAQSDGAWGNVFILSAAHFFDWRGVALEAGVAPGKFPNGDIQPNLLPQTMLNGLLRQGQFALDPDRYIVIIYHVADQDTAALLATWFPEGIDMVVDTRRDTPWLTNEQYRTFRIPPPGLDRLREFFDIHGLQMPAR